MDLKKNNPIKALVLVGIPVIILFVALIMTNLNSTRQAIRVSDNMLPGRQISEESMLYTTLEECTQHTNTTMKCERMPDSLIDVPSNTPQPELWRVVPGNHP